AGLGEGEVANLVDEIDALEGALGLEDAFDQRLGIGGVETEGDLDFVLAGGHVAQREEPDHKRVNDGELAAADVGENTEDGVFAAAGIDVDAVTGEPGENLGGGVHG